MKSPLHGSWSYVPLIVLALLEIHSACFYDHELEHLLGHAWLDFLPEAPMVCKLYIAHMLIAWVPSKITSPPVKAPHIACT